jgi:hypothetical protein
MPPGEASIKSPPASVALLLLSARSEAGQVLGRTKELRRGKVPRGEATKASVKAENTAKATKPLRSIPLMFYDYQQAEGGIEMAETLPKFRPFSTVFFFPRLPLSIVLPRKNSDCL